MSQVYQPKPLEVDPRSITGRWPSHPRELRQRRNAFGIASLMTGILSVILSLIPVVGSAASLLGPLAIVLALMGGNRRRTGKKTATAGLVLGAASLVISIIVTVFGGHSVPRAG
jgi:lysylphosphatidylglycerol synthetase-like protein (DUF2156 family)